MKKKIALICLTTLCLTACSDENGGDVDNILGEYENNNIGISNEWDGKNYLNSEYLYAETTGAFYYQDLYNRIMYFNKENHEIFPLCAKPDCAHEVEFGDNVTSDCAAFYNSSMYNQVYNGKLYADIKTDDGYICSLYVSLLDGTDRTKVIENIEKSINEEQERMNEEDVEALASNLYWTIHEDIVYVFSTICDKENTKLFIDKYNINDGSYIEQLMSKTVKGSYGTVDNVNINDNEIWVSVEVRQYLSDGSGDYDYATTYMQIGANDGDVKIVNVPANEASTIVNGHVLYQPDFDHVYMMDSDSNSSLCIELNEFEKKYGVIIKTIGDYIFVTPFFRAAEGIEEYSYYTKLYDKDYKLVDTIELPEDMLPKAGHNQILFQSREDDSYYGIDASQIGTGNVEFEKYES